MNRVNIIMIVKCILAFVICLLLISCFQSWKIIEIGEYDYHLEMWNNQDIKDYQLLI